MWRLLVLGKYAVDILSELASFPFVAEGILQCTFFYSAHFVKSGPASWRGVDYGALDMQVLREHVEALKPVVAELARLETMAQEFYYRRKHSHVQISGLKLS
jgi:hypothetical protein